MLPSKRKAADVKDRNEGAHEVLRGQGERMLEVVLETCGTAPDQLAKWMAAPLGAAAQKDMRLSQKLNGLLDGAEGASEALLGEGERILDIVLETTGPHQLAEWLGATLEVAATQADEGLCMALVQAGAEICDVALHHGIRGGSVAVVDLLLENGASAVGLDDSGPLEALDEFEWHDGEDPLGFAARCGNVEIARSLMREGAGPGDEDCQQRTPLSYAIEEGDVAMVEAFLEDGAIDLNHRVGEFHRSPLDDAAQSKAKESLDVLRMIINHGAEVNSVACDGETALHKAAKANNNGVVRVLVEAGAGINEGGTTPLHAAADGLALEGAVALLECGADVNAKTEDGQTALHLAAAKAERKVAIHVVDLLLQYGADEKVVCNCGKTAEDIVGGEHIYLYRIPNGPRNVERVRSLLARARVWRRRRLLVLCRAFPDRVRLGGDFANLASAILGLVEHSVFRKIVGYL